MLRLLGVLGVVGAGAHTPVAVGQGVRAWDRTLLGRLSKGRHAVAVGQGVLAWDSTLLGHLSKGRHAVDTLGFVTPGVLATVYGS